MEHHKILNRTSAAITSWEELDTLGIWLGCDHNDVRRLRNVNHSIKDVAYEILCSFYDSVANEKRWGTLIEALQELNKHKTVKD